MNFHLHWTYNWIDSDEEERRGGQAWNTQAIFVLSAYFSGMSGCKQETIEHEYCIDPWGEIQVQNRNDIKQSANLYIETAL